MRDIRFRGKRIDNGELVQGYLFKIWEQAYILWGTTNGIPNMIEVHPETVGQYTGLKDKNEIEIWEGDRLRVRRPNRDQQTHYGDNIPMGEYTEPLEPIISEYEKVVNFKDGMFGCVVEDEDHLPLKWLFVDTFAENEDELKEMFSGGWGHKIFEGWEDDLEYLFDQYKVTSVDELIKYIGVEVIGNIYESQPELVTS